MTPAAERGRFGPTFGSVLVAAQAGAPWALTVIFETLAPAVAGYLRAQRADDPDDLTSDVFLRVFGHVARFEGSETSFRSWVFSIAHNRLVDQRRRLARRPAVVPIEEATATMSGGDTEEEALIGLAEQRVQELLATLPGDQRDVLLLRVVADLTVDQVAVALAKSPGAVKALQRRAIARLRRQLTDRPVPL